MPFRRGQIPASSERSPFLCITEGEAQTILRRFERAGTPQRIALQGEQLRLAVAGAPQTQIPTIVIHDVECVKCRPDALLVQYPVTKIRRNAGCTGSGSPLSRPLRLMLSMAAPSLSSSRRRWVLLSGGFQMSVKEADYGAANVAGQGIAFPGIQIKGVTDAFEQ